MSCSPAADSGAYSKENTVIRGALDPSIVYVIPNAVVPSNFVPPEMRGQSRPQRCTSDGTSVI